MKFRAPPDAIERMCRGRFTPSDRETFVRAYGREWNDLPESVRSWFLPAVERADHFYTAKPFDRSYTTHNEAVLCYDEKTGMACFHWLGID
jgi:hypothetical protein